MKARHIVMPVDRSPGYYWIKLSKYSPWTVGEWAEWDDWHESDPARHNHRRQGVERGAV